MPPCARGFLPPTITSPLLVLDPRSSPFAATLTTSLGIYTHDWTPGTALTSCIHLCGDTSLGYVLACIGCLSEYPNVGPTTAISASPTFLKSKHSADDVCGRQVRSAARRNSRLLSPHFSSAPSPTTGAVCQTTLSAQHASTRLTGILPAYYFLVYPP
jgi:hypothetical protein